MSSKSNPFIRSMVGGLIGWILIIAFSYFLYQAILGSGDWGPLLGVVIVWIVFNLLGKNFSATDKEFQEWNSDNSKKKFYEVLRSQGYSVQEIDHEWKKRNEK